MKWLKSIYESEHNKPYYLISETEAIKYDSADNLQKWTKRELMKVFNNKSLKPQEIGSLETNFIWKFYEMYSSPSEQNSPPETWPARFFSNLKLEEPDQYSTDVQRKSTQDTIEQKSKIVDFYMVQRQMLSYLNGELKYSHIEFNITKIEDDWFIVNNWVTPYKRSNGGSIYKCDGIRGLLTYLSDNGFIEK